MTYWLESFWRVSERGRIDVGACKSVGSRVRAVRKQYQKAEKRTAKGRTKVAARVASRVKAAFAEPRKKSSPPQPSARGDEGSGAP